MTEPPPIRCVVTVPGLHAASVFPVSRTTFKLMIRISVILSRGAERTCGLRATGGTHFRNSRRRIRGASSERVPEIAAAAYLRLRPDGRPLVQSLDRSRRPDDLDICVKRPSGSI